AQALESVVASVDHVLARQPLLRRPRILRCAEVDLAGNAESVARQAQVGDHVAHHPLGLAVAVALGVVEEVDAVVPGGGDQLARFATPDLVAEGDPRAERQRGKLQAGGTEATVLHRGDSVPVESPSYPAYAGSVDERGHGRRRWRGMRRCGWCRRWCRRRRD